MLKDRTRFAWMKVFGWIDREDGYKDFVVLGFEVEGKNHAIHHIMTSSARFSEEINIAVGEESHTDCQRVESFVSIPNSIKLEAAARRSK